MSTSYEMDINQLVSRLTHPDEDIRTDTVVLLQEIADLRVIKPVVAMLEDYCSKVRTAAANTLGTLGSDIAIPALIACASDPDPQVRRAVILALKLLVKSPRRTDVFLDALTDVNKGIQLLAVQAVGIFQDRRATVPLIDLVNTADGAIWRNAVNGLGKLKDTRAVTPLIDLLNSTTEPAQRRSIIAALGHIGDERALTVITQGVYDPEPSVRVQSILALGNIKHPATLDLLCDLAHDPVPEIRAAAARALGLLAHPKAVPVLRLLLNDTTMLPYITVDEIAANSLSAIDTPVANAAVEAWALYLIGTGREEIVTIRAIRKLKKRRNQRVLDVMLELLQTDAADIRAEAAQVLGHLGDKRAVAPLLHMAENDLERVRPDALYALSLLGDRRAHNLFVMALDDPYLPIRVEGALGLASFMDNRAVPMLAHCLNNRRRFIAVHRPDYLGDYAEEALQQMDTPDARLALQLWEHSLI